jgi:hypothetical protein
MKRRQWLTTLAALAAGSLTGMAAGANQPGTRPVIEVWKSPSCGCCHDWMAHLQANGFDVKTHDVSEAAKHAQRQRLGLAERFGSCHTGFIGGYVIEGHVPAREIHRLLKDRPRALGLAVPGMPVGSPGMDGPAYGGRRDPYEVLLVQGGGTASIFQSYR